MNRLLNMVCSTVAMITVSTTVFAQTTTLDKKSSTKKAAFFNQGAPLACSTENYAPGYSAPAGVLIANGSGLNINASFLYWYPLQDAMDLAYVFPEEKVQGTVIEQSSKFQPGFKVGFGYDMYIDNWAVNADYTWFHTNVSTGVYKADLAPTTLFPNYYYDQNESFGTSTFIGSCWKVHLDMIDLVVGRPYYKGTHVTVAPTGGVRALFLRQKLKATLQTDNMDDSISSSQSRSWAIGPKAGVGTKYLFENGFRLENMLGASMLYTRYTILSNVETVTNGELQGVFPSEAKNVSAVRPTVDMGFGLGFSSYTLDNKLFVDVSARYDFAQYWSQNMMRKFAAGLNGHSERGDLAIHGLTLNVRCDF